MKRDDEDFIPDPFDADHDATEVPQGVVDRDDLSFRRAQPPALPPFHPETHQRCAEAAALLKSAQRRAAPPSGAPRKSPACWHATPEPFRKLICRAAGLQMGVVAKLDRDLSETEKAMIRAAAARLKEKAEELFAL